MGDYSSPKEAKAAIKQLNKTTIEGNSRFMDVILAGSIPPGEGKKAGKQGGAKQGGGKQGGGNQMQQMQKMQQFMTGKSGGVSAGPKGVIKNNLKAKGNTM